MKIVFLGFQKWGWVALRGLIDSRHDVVLVITHSQDKSSYKGSFLDKSVKKLAESNQIPVLECKNVNRKEIIKKIKEANPDVIISSDWETWISPEVVGLAKKAAINVHDALLPKYAGFSPVNWAIINDEKVAGVTVHYIEEEFDQGEIILQETVSIENSDTIIEVLEKIFKKIPEITLKSLELIEREEVEAKKQDLSKASFNKKILEKDCEINWNNPQKNIYNFIRALAGPFSNAFTYWQNKKIKIKKASITDKIYSGVPGKVVCSKENGVVVLCGKSKNNQSQCIVIEEIEDEKGKVWRANEYFLKTGLCLGKKNN
ncbi:MAG: methionyl-tRNA formyltransferase [Candidatus Omnitrophica bacterium]|nr:methionyl-tRNA formyltransferase [Candidatus Omnitrophota bacterium]